MRCALAFVPAAGHVGSLYSMVISWRNACKHGEKLHAGSAHCCDPSIQPSLEAAGGPN